jgi:hypothetical protein
VLFSDAPEDVTTLSVDDRRLWVICLHCLIDEYPELGPGLDLARAHGWAERREDGEWSPSPPDDEEAPA